MKKYWTRAKDMVILFLLERKLKAAKKHESEMITKTLKLWQ